MRSTFTLGRVAGIEIGLNWTWLVVFALIVWSLTEGVFPLQVPGLSTSTYLVMGLLAAALYFVSILLHELGHAVQARREGVRVEGITLWLFGGVAQFSGSFPSAGAELRIAIAGPLVTVAVGIVCVVIGLLSGLPPAVDGVAAWLGYMNFLLLGFNLLPALPLDGGRVLRALLWQARGDLAWATRLAAGAGRAFGYAFIAAGIALFIFQGAFTGAWLAFIGWFLLSAAGAEARYLAAQQALDGLRVRDLMVRDPVTVSPMQTIGEVMDGIVWQRRYTTYPVADAGRVLGLLPFRCLVAVPRTEWEVHRVRECMIPLREVPVAREDEAVVDVLPRLTDSGINRALVLDGDRILGLLSITDVTMALEIGGPRRPAPSR
jgi:Zn-dependent protease/CBS domain-containing protein